jgi:hypothetical protein
VKPRVDETHGKHSLFRSLREGLDFLILILHLTDANLPGFVHDALS